MRVSFQQLVAILPLLIIGITLISTMLVISWRRNHFINATITSIGLIFSFFSLFFSIRETSVDITSLLRIDNYSIFYTGLVLIGSLSTCIFSYSFLSVYPNNREEFYLLILISTIGGVVLTGANHLASLFLGIELISLPLFGLVGYVNWSKPSLEAAIKYMLLSASSSSFLLFGIALLYSELGDLSLVFFNKSLIQDNLVYQSLILVGLGMVIVSLFFKLSLVPFQLWTPDVYQGAPTVVSMFLSTCVKIAIFSAMTRFFLYIPTIDSKVFRLIFSIISCCSILFGNIMAISQTNIKRFLGYSSISHMGYLLISLITIHHYQFSLETIGIYLIGYLFSTLGLFGVISLIKSFYPSVKDDSLFSYQGFFWHEPILSIIMTIMIFSLAGVPITLGFIGKFFLILLSVHEHLWWLTGIIVLGSAIGFYYYMRIAISLYFKPQETLYYCTSKNWVLSYSGLVVLLSTSLVIWLGVYPQPLINFMKITKPFLG